jgi:hypothetical protein
MKYPEGQDIKVGDLIWWEEGVFVGHIQVIAESKDDYESWGLTEPHIFVANNHPFDPSIKTGVAHEFSCLEDEGIGLLSIEEISKLNVARNSAIQIASSDFTKHNYSIATECVNNEMVCWIFSLMSGNSVIEEIRIPWL